MSWQSSVRSLLRDLKRSKGSTPSGLQLAQLHVDAYESEGEIAWDNTQPIWDIIGSKEGKTSRFVTGIELRSSRTPRCCSKYVSAILVGWIKVLSKQIAEKIKVTRNYKLRITNDTYSLGVFAELILSYRSADAVTTFPHNVRVDIPFSAVLIRERSRPDAALTTAELYFVLAMAARHRKLFDVRSINLRLVIVYSQWVQVLNVTTTVPYIASIVNGEAAIADKMIIHQTSWFDFSDASGQLQALLSIFEGLELESKVESERASKAQTPLQDITTNALIQRSKRSLVDREELENQRSKSQRVSYT